MTTRSGFPWEVQGTGSPVGSVDAPVGMSYRDISNGDLWQHTGPTNTDWLLVIMGTNSGGNPSPGYYGYAELGDVTLNAGGTVLSSAIGPSAAAWLFFRDLHITNNTVLQLDPNLAPNVLFIDGTLTIDAGSFIDASGQPGVGVVGGIGGANSNSTNLATADGANGRTNNPGFSANGGPNFWAVTPKTGGAGGAGGANAGGNPVSGIGAIAFAAAHLTSRPLGSILLQSSALATGPIGDTSGGGGGGSDNNLATGGGGGGGGGVLLIYARHVVLANGSLRARGGNGAAGFGTGGNAGGGGGGLGGVLLLSTQDIVTPAVIADVAGGVGGNGFGAGDVGATGSLGEVIIATPAGVAWTH